MCSTCADIALNSYRQEAAAVFDVRNVSCSVGTSLSCEECEHTFLTSPSLNIHQPEPYRETINIH